MSSSLGPLVIAANAATSFQTPNDGVKAILIGNESGLTVTITMESGGVQKTLYPSTLDWFQVNKGFTGNIKITPTVILNNISTFPSSSLIFDAIGLNDPEDASMYPVSLNRSMTVGGNVSTVGGTSSAIANDNNVAGSQIIESTVKSDGASAVSLTNDAVFVLGDVAHPGSLTAAGPATINNSLFVSGGAFTTTLDGGPPNIVTDGHGRMTLAGTGMALTLSGGGLAFLTGSITRLSKFPASLTNVATFFNHGLGDTPDIILISFSDLHVTLHIATYEASSMTTTQVKMQADANVNVTCLAIKF